MNSFHAQGYNESGYVKVYAMDDPDNDNFYPGKDLTSLKKRFKEAFYPDNDPDHNCYIEMHIEDKKKDTEYRDTITPEPEHLHFYSIVGIDKKDKATAYHEDGFKHPLDTAQLIGIKAFAPKMHILGIEEYNGLTAPYPHCWVAAGKIEEDVCTGFGFRLPPVKEEGYKIPPNVTIRIKLTPKDEKKEPIAFDVPLTGDEGKIMTTIELSKKINEARQKAGLGLFDFHTMDDTFKTTLRFGPDSPRETLHYVSIICGDKFKKLEFIGLSETAVNLIKSLRLDRKFPVPANERKELVAVHEVGHALYNAACEFGSALDKPPLALKNKDLTDWFLRWDNYIKTLKKLKQRYHYNRLSISTSSASMPGYITIPKFSPLICRDFRCSIFRFYRRDISEEEPNGSPSGD